VTNESQDQVNQFLKARLQEAVEHLIRAIDLHEAAEPLLVAKNNAAIDSNGDAIGKEIKAAWKGLDEYRDACLKVAGIWRGRN
jgi:hypothetical protein